MLCCTCLSACKRAPVVERGFYYWKSNDKRLSSDELHLMIDTHINKLYVKFFEVERSGGKSPIPVEKTQLEFFADENARLLKPELEPGGKFHDLQIIPVIFIRNDVLNLPEYYLDDLADNMVYLTNKYFYEKYSKSIPPLKEIQLDCDWTPSTKDHYFYLINKIRQLSKKEISCTLRLYPFKYPEKMGVPPVDRATLMCYNLIGPFADEQRNSILDVAELEKYLKDAKPYPVPLDYVLPCYSWDLVFQNNMFTGVLRDKIVSSDTCFKRESELWYEVQYDKVVSNFFLRPGDRIKHESVSIGAMDSAIQLLNTYMDYDDTITVSVFHLDDLNLEPYGSNTIDRFYSAVH